MAEELAAWLHAHDGLSRLDHVGLLGPRSVAILLPERAFGEQLSVAARASGRLSTMGTHGTTVLYTSGLKLDTATLPDEDSPAVETRPLAELFAQRQGFFGRAFDVVLAGTALLLLWPLLVLIGLAIRLSSAGPALFRQERIGLGNRPFTLLKFRTMRHDAERYQEDLRGQNEQDGPAFKMQNDPRVTPFGGVLRRTCIDELPQLWNILRGEMTFVGPRPLPTPESRCCEAWHHERLDVKPGLTCSWQIDRSPAMPFADWMRLDIRYTRGRTIRTDLILILRTIRAVAFSWRCPSSE
ncbi:MAG: sugar transferase [Planctomycetota bacterium]